VKILYHHRIRSRDGQAVHLEELISALREQGNEVAIVGPEAFERARFGDDAKLLSRIKAALPSAIYELLEICYNIPAYFRLRAAWRRFQPQCIYERHNLYVLAGIWLKKRAGIPLLLEVNAPLARERREHGGLALKRLAAAMERWVWRNADFVLPVTQVLANEIQAAGVPPEKIIVIANAIDPKKFASAVVERETKAEARIVLGFTGFVRDWHGLEAIIDALDQPGLRDMQLTIVGDGPALPALKAQAQRLGVADRVLFPGLVDRDRIAHAIAGFDIALQPKCVGYSSPLKLFEYMALGKAIVAPDQPNIREVLVSGQNGLLFDPERPQALIETITDLAKDSALRARLGGAASKTIDQRGYTWHENASRVVVIAERALALTVQAGREPHAAATSSP
jgi:glycosyltransferase involved in cell wall biosynthesis